MGGLKKISLAAADLFQWVLSCVEQCRAAKTLNSPTKLSTCSTNITPPESPSSYSARQPMDEDEGVLANTPPLKKRAELAEEVEEQFKADLDVLDKGDLQELKALSRPPKEVVTVLQAVMQLLAGSEPCLELDEEGAPKDCDWKGAMKLMGNQRKLLQNLASSKERIAAGKMPAENVERARAILQENDLGKEHMFEKAKAAVVSYYDAIEQARAAAVCTPEGTLTASALWQ